ncbi:hypothetical protein Tco_0571034 [Tanacetum coccineum]
MAKQKIILKVTTENDKKSRKAMKIAVGLSGVESASFIGSDKHQIAVTGEGIDPVKLAKKLRKGVGYSELVSVGPMEEKKPVAVVTPVAQPQAKVVPLRVYPYHYNHGVPYHVHETPYNNQPLCTIL